MPSALGGAARSERLTRSAFTNATMSRSSAALRGGSGACPCANSRQRREPATLTAAAMQALARYPWPGNIRELRNAMDYAAVAAEGDEIDVWHLPPTVAGDLTATTTADVVGPSASDARPPSSFRPIADEVRALERRRMVQALAAAGGVQTRAAELLAMPRRTFVAKMRAYDLHQVAQT